MPTKTTNRRKKSTTATKPAAKAAKPAAKAKTDERPPIERLPKVKVQQTVNGTFEVAQFPKGNGGVKLTRKVGDNDEATYMSQDEWNRLGRPAQGVKVERRFLLA